MERGTVKFFDGRRGFGKIEPDEGGEPLFVHISEVHSDRRVLVQGEPVEYEMKEGDRGPVAGQVRCVESRMLGTVESFDNKRGTGTIAGDQENHEFFVHYTDIVSDKPFKTLEEGQEVTFVATVEDEGRSKALRVVPDPRMPLERFAYLADFEDKLQQLAKRAQEDHWEYRYHEAKRPLPILWNYIHYTFRRLAVEGKIATTQNPDREQALACFNTGLATNNYEPIFAAFHENARDDTDEEWVLIGFFKESQHPITLFEKRPDPANYFTEPAELVYDRRIELVCNVDHIVRERIDRFPEPFREKPEWLATALRVAIQQAERRVLQNYKTAIPMYHRGKIQLLLPLCLDNPPKADVALVVGREGRVYKGYTVLTLDMAYNNARLLTRPDREWLIP